MGAQRERRCMIYAISGNQIADLFNSRWHATRVSDVWVPGLPADATVVSVNTDWASHTIEVMFCSQVFQPVPEGCEVPRVAADRVECVVWRREDRGDEVAFVRPKTRKEKEQGSGENDS